MDDKVRVRSFEEAEAHIRSLRFNQDGPDQMQDRIRRLEKLADVMNTPLWKRLVFAIDGWPWFRLVDHPQWRPWRRWWTS